MTRGAGVLAWPARWLVPLFIALLALLALGFRYADQMHSVHRDVPVEQASLLRERLNLEQARLDLVEGQGNPLLPRRLVSSLKIHDLVQLAYLVSADGRIEAAFSRQDVGRQLGEAIALQLNRHPHAGWLKDWKASSALAVWRPDGTGALIGLVPLKDGRSLRVLADLERPLALHEVKVRGEVMREGLFLLAGVVVLTAFLHLFWFRRAKQLTDALSRMGAGDLSVRTSLAGSDELAHIGDAADRMAMALQAEQAELRHVKSLVDRSPAVVIEWRNAPGWPVSYVSESVVQWGYQPGELLAGDLRYNDLFHADDVERVNQEIAGYFAEGPDDYRQEYRIRCGDGRWVWIDDRTSLSRNDSGEVEGIRGVLLDITEQKTAQIKQREQAELLRLFFELPFTGMAITSPQDKRWLQVNDRLCQILGYPRELLLQKTWAEITHPDDLEANLVLFRQLLAGEVGGYQMNKRFLRADGGVVHAELDVRAVRYPDGSLKHLFTTVQDVTERVEAERALREQERLLAEAQRVASLGNWNLDLQSGEALWSAEEYRLLGYEPDTVEPTLDHFMQAVHPDDRERVQSAMQRAMLAAGDHDYQVEHRVVHGTAIRHLEQRGRVDFDDQDRPVRMFGTTLDVTERKAAEAAMRRSEERYMLAARIGRSGAWEMWPKEGKIFFDANLTRLLGYEVDELSEDLADWYGTVPEHARAGIEGALQAVIEGRVDSYRIEHPVRHKDGSTGWLLAQGRRISAPGEVPLRLIGSSLDITERVQASQILLDLKDMLEQAEMVSQLGSWAFDSDTGFLRWSPQMFRNMGLPWSEVPPSIDAYCDRIHPDDVKPVRAAIDRLVRGEEVPTVVFRTHPAYGPVRWMRRMVQRMPREAEGKGPRYIGVLLDITEAMEADERLRHINEELERRVAERTEQLSVANRELEAFSYSVSHDLKAPLRGIDGYSQLLEEEYGARLDDDGRLFVRQVRQGVRQMGELINDMLEYSRMERRDMTQDPVDLAPLVDAVLQNHQVDIERLGVEVVVNVPSLTLPLDREGIALVLRNLVGNALKFSAQSKPPRLEIGVRLEPQRRILWVRDNGVGFDMKYHDRIFGVFQRLHRTEEFAGTGVGLALVAKAVSRMGGKVWAESAPGAGATFFLEFPNEPENALAPILLVEDNPMDLDLTLRAFRKKQFVNEILVARDGEEALAHVDRWDAGEALPAVILLDINLPKVNGLEVLRQLKEHERYRRIPVVMLTSSREDRDLKAAYDLGVNSYIEKPVSFSKFVEVAEQIELYWCVLNERPQ